MTSKQKTTGTNSELSLNLNASYTICQTKRPTFGPKAKVRQFLVLFLDIIFFDGIFPLSFRSLPEATRVENPGSPEATASTMWPSLATSRRCGTSSAWLRSACTRKIQLAGSLKRMAELLVPLVLWVEGARRRSNILKFGVSRNLD